MREKMKEKGRKREVDRDTQGPYSLHTDEKSSSGIVEGGYDKGRRMNRQRKRKTREL